MKKKKLALAIVILAARCYGIKRESVAKVLNEEIHEKKVAFLLDMA